jgi:hypothetical protein
VWCLVERSSKDQTTMSKNRFKVVYSNPGIKHQNVFVNSIRNAISKACAKGWFGVNGSGDCWDSCPRESLIFERVDINGYETWELIARVNSKEIIVTPVSERHSVKTFETRIQELSFEIQGAKELETSLQLLKKEMNK